MTYPGWGALFVRQTKDGPEFLLIEADDAQAVIRKREDLWPGNPEGHWLWSSGAVTTKHWEDIIGNAMAVAEET